MSRIYPPHRTWLPAGQCGCIECHERIKRLRCPVVCRDPNDRRRKFRCGDYAGHSEPEHTMLIATAFLP